MARFSVRRIALLAILSAVVAIQFFPTGLDRTPPDPAQALEATLQPGPEVVSILARSCNDCHGTPKSWPWYARVAPVSWLVAHDVSEAKKHTDFAHWVQYSPRRQAKLLENMCEEVTQGEMPLGNYVRMHRDAKLTPAQVQLFCAWTERERARLAAGER